MTVRLATFDDISAILAISNRAAEVSPANFATAPEPLEMWQRQFEDHAHVHPWLVAEMHDGRIIAFARSTPWKTRGAYSWTAEVSVYVDPAHHRRGIGRALYERLLGIMQAQGWRTLLAGITQPNEPSVRLHESLGFRHIGTIQRAGHKDGAWHDVGYWEKTFGGAEAPLPVKTISEVLCLPTSG